MAVVNNHLTGAPIGLTSEQASAGSTGVLGLTAAGAESALSGVLRGHRLSDVRVVTFGDSTANIGISSSPDSYDTRTVTAPFPPSGATVIGGGEACKWITSMFYPRARLVGNCGVSGDTTLFMLNRDVAVASATRKAIADAISVQPDVAAYRGGSINDLQGVNAGNYAATVAACIANHRKILGRLLAGIPRAIDCGIFGYGDGSAATSSTPELVRQAVLECNAAFKAMASSFGGRVVYLDPQAIGIQAADGRLVPGLSNDGIHLNINGGVLLGQAEAAVLAGMFGPSAGPSYPGTNLMPEAMMQGTTAYAGGVRPNGFTFSGATPTASSIDVVDGLQMWTVDATVASGSQTILMNAPFPISTLGLLAGDVIAAEFDFEWLPLSGFAPTMTGLYARLDLYKTAAGRVVHTANACAIFSSSLPAPSLKGRAVFLPLVLSEPSANLTTACQMVLNVGLSSASGGQARFRFGVPRLVKL